MTLDLLSLTAFFLFSLCPKVLQPVLYIGSLTRGKLSALIVTSIAAIHLMAKSKDSEQQ
jgi:hypothetical protein